MAIVPWLVFRTCRPGAALGKLPAFLWWAVAFLSMDARRPYRFGNLLALARKSWIEQVGERVREAGFPGYRRSDAAVLAYLLPRPLAIGQLGEALGVTRQAARQLADGLAERGYASFGTDEADARRTLVILTPRGKSYGRAIWMAQDALNETVRSRVSEADLAAADAVLRAVFPDASSRQRIDERMPPPITLPGCVRTRGCRDGCRARAAAPPCRRCSSP
jgi:DNA-binding MarR family transcriptional regulator